MSDSKTTHMEVWFDTSNAETSVQCLNDMVAGLKTSLDGVVGKLEEMVELMSTQEGGWLDSLVGGVDAFNTMADGGKNLESIFSAINKGAKAASKTGEEFSLFKALFPETRDFVGSISAGIGDYTAAVKAAQPEVGTFAAMFPKLSTVFSDVGQKLKNMGNTIGSTFKGLNSVITGIGWGVLIAAVAALVVFIIQNWDAIKAAIGKAAEWINVNIIQPVVGFFTNAMNWISTKVQEGFAFVQSIFMGVNEFLQNIFAKDWTEQFGAFGNVLNAFFANVENIWNAIKTVFSGIVTFVKSVFAGDWQAAWDGIVGIFSGIWEGIVAYVKVPINAIIGFINGLISGIVGGINLVIGALNHISVEIPDWDIFGSLAGKRFGFDFALLNAPQIPYLAKGAVLPANKPFLAMVGDQKHGTNVEAPLSTIQEAVAVVMEDMIASNMAGHEATVGVLREILSAVLGIQIGDDVIGQAVARYGRKMAVMRGGYV